jgi:hypothetical protein
MRPDVPQERVCPAETLAAIKAVDPTCDLIYMGEGLWLLGSYSPTGIRWNAGQKRLRRVRGARIVNARDRARWSYIHFEGLLLCAGFAPIHVFGAPNRRYTPGSEVAEYLSERGYNWARDVDNAWRESLATEHESRDDLAISSYFDEYKLRHAYKAMVKAMRPARAVTVTTSLKAS